MLSLTGQVHGLCSRVKGLCRGGSAPMRGPPVLEEAGGEGEGGVAELCPPPLLLPPLLVPGTPDPLADTPGPLSLFLLPALALSVIWSVKNQIIYKNSLLEIITVFKSLEKVATNLYYTFNINISLSWVLS